MYVFTIKKKSVDHYQESINQNFYFMTLTWRKGNEKKIRSTEVLHTKLNDKKRERKKKRKCTLIFIINWLNLLDEYDYLDEMKIFF